MGISYNPRTITDGLVLCLDAGNPKSYDKYENLLQYSEQFDNAYWTKSSGVIATANQIIAPDGTLTADLITDSVTGEAGFYGFFTGSENTTHTYSVFVKAGTATQVKLRDFDGGLNPGHHVVFNFSTLILEKSDSLNSTFG